MAIALLVRVPYRGMYFFFTLPSAGDGEGLMATQNEHVTQKNEIANANGSLTQTQTINDAVKVAMCEAKMVLKVQNFSE